MQFISKFHFGQYHFNQQILYKLSALLEIPFYKMNNEINYVGEVRLLNSRNILIGKLDIEEAREKANSQDSDIILINEEVVPPLCKLCDYSDELATKFLTQIHKIPKLKIRDQPLKLGHNITHQDLTIKVMHAQEILKKQNKIRVYIISPLAYALQSRNILFTFRDLCNQVMTPINDIKIKEYIPKVDYTKTKEEREEEFVQLDYEFEALSKQNFEITIPQLKLERLINKYFAQLILAEQLNSKEAIQEVKEKGIKELYDENDADIPEELLTNEKLFSRKSLRQSKYKIKQKQEDKIELDQEIQTMHQDFNNLFMEKSLDMKNKFQQFKEIIGKESKSKQ